MAIRVITQDIQEKPLFPHAAEALKIIFDLLSTVSNPTEFYENLIQGGLEQSAIDKIKKLEEMKVKVNEEAQRFFERERKIKRIAELRGQIAEIEKIESARNVSYEGILQEIAKFTEEVKKLQHQIRKYEEGIAKIDQELAKIEQVRAHGRGQNIPAPGILENEIERLLTHSRDEQHQRIQTWRRELDRLQEAIVRDKGGLKRINEELSEASRNRRNLEAEIASLK